MSFIPLTEKLKNWNLLDFRSDPELYPDPLSRKRIRGSGSVLK